MADEAAPEQEQPKKKKKLVFTAAIVLGVAVLQGGAFFTFAKLMGRAPAPTQAAQATEHAAPPEAPPPEAAGSSELVLLQRFKVPNSKSGAIIIYDLDISVVVSAAHKNQMEEVLKNRAAEISDRIAQVVRGAPARVLGEDDLGSLRRLLKGTLGEVIGDDEIVQRVLIPRCVPLRTE